MQCTDWLQTAKSSEHRSKHPAKHAYHYQYSAQHKKYCGFKVCNHKIIVLSYPGALETHQKTVYSERKRKAWTGRQQNFSQYCQRTCSDTVSYLHLGRAYIVLLNNHSNDDATASLQKNNKQNQLPNRDVNVISTRDMSQLTPENPSKLNSPEKNNPGAVPPAVRIQFWSKIQTPQPLTTDDDAPCSELNISNPPTQSLVIDHSYAQS